MKTESDFQPDPAAGYERRDVNIRAILWLGAGIVVCAVVAMAGLWLMLRGLERQAASRDPTISPLAAEKMPPAGPPLQPMPVHDFEAFRASQQQVLTSYGWVDRQEKVVHIPIDRAIELLLERGEPEPPESPPQRENP